MPQHQSREISAECFIVIPSDQTDPDPVFISVDQDKHLALARALAFRSFWNQTRLFDQAIIRKAEVKITICRTARRQ